MPELRPEQRQSIEAALFAGNKIDAIKQYREFTGAGLADAKQAVETMEAGLRKAKPEQFTKPAGKSGCLGLMLGIATILALLMVVLEFWS